MDLLVEHDGHGNSVAQPAYGWALRAMYSSSSWLNAGPAEWYAQKSLEIKTRTTAYSRIRVLNACYQFVSG